MKTLLDHQRRCWPYIERNVDGLALFMHMRLGKTLLAIRWAMRHLFDTILVVTPYSTTKSWKEELEGENQTVTLLTGNSRRKLRLANNEKTDWYLVNPEGVRACPLLLDILSPQTVICDESTFLRNPRAGITKVMLRRCSARYRAILTGNPAPEGLQDYVTQMLFLDGEFMGCSDFYQWRVHHMLPGFHKYEVKPTSVPKIREAIATRALTMTTEEAGIEMPIVHERRYVTAPPEIRAVYKRAVKEYRCGEASTKWTLAMKTWLAQLSSGLLPKAYRSDRLVYSPYKLKELMTLLTGELSGERCIVFCRFTREIDHLTRMLKTAGIAATYLTGEISVKSREDRIRRFNDGGCQIIVGQASKVCEKGMDLSSAGALIFLSNLWSWESRSQLEMRACHPTKTASTLVLDVVTENTIDEAVVEALAGKSKSTAETTAEIIRIAKERRLL